MSLKLLNNFNKLARPKLPDKLKGTIVERWINYWKGLMNDYKDVGFETLKFIKANRIKSSTYGAAFVSGYACYKTNPNYQQYLDQLIKSQNSVALVHPDCQNVRATSFLKFIEENKNAGRLRYTSLWFVSILWIHDFSDNLATAKSTCKYLQPKYSTFQERIIDVGFWNKWWNIENQMKDYDVNF